MTKDKGITRRSFLKKAGKGATALGVASILPKFVKPATAAKRDYILIGHPTPVTGPIAGFGETAEWVTKRGVREINERGGLYIKEYGKKLPLKIKSVDTESNPTKAGEIASRLILKDKIDIMMAYGTPATVNPATSICERFKVPCIATNDPIEMWLTGGPYHWSFLYFGLVPDLFPAYYGMWEQLGTNKVVGMLAANDVDGVAIVKASKEILIPRGYKIVDLGLVPYGLKDYSSIISAWKKANVEIVFGNMIPPDWTTAWRQCRSLGFKPKVATVGRCLLFPSDINAIGGEFPNGLSAEFWWGPTYPHKSSISGYGPKDLCDAWEAATKKQWIQTLGFEYATFEILFKAMNRVQTLNKEKIRDALAATDMETIVGRIKFNKKNYCPVPIVGAQWVKGKKWPWEPKIVYNGKHEHIPTQGKMIPIP